MWEPDGFEGSRSRHAVATESVLGLPDLQPSLLDDVSLTARRRGGGACTNSGTARTSGSHDGCTGAKAG